MEIHAVSEILNDLLRGCASELRTARQIPDIPAVALPKLGAWDNAFVTLIIQNDYHRAVPLFPNKYNIILLQFYRWRNCGK